MFFFFKVTENSQSETSISSGETKSKGIIHFLPNEAKLVSQPNRDLDTKEKNSLADEEDDAEEDPFFDNPIPKPEQTYGWYVKCMSVSMFPLGYGFVEIFKLERTVS